MAFGVAVDRFAVPGAAVQRAGGHRTRAEPEELAAAYALTGLNGDVTGNQRNAVYHRGMKPDAAWNAMQVSDWLDDVLGTDLFNVEDIPAARD